MVEYTYLFSTSKVKTMIDFLSRIAGGDDSVNAAFRLAYLHWQEALQGTNQWTVRELADIASELQGALDLDTNFARGLVKEIMPYAALLSLYDPSAGFEDRRELALKLVEAFYQSTCSAEVKFGMRRAAVVFSLNDAR